jgi:hypothetical protein
VARVDLGLAAREELGCYVELGRSAGVFFLFLLCFLLFAKPFLAPKQIRKIQIKYLWIPCEKGFILEQLLK